MPCQLLNRPCRRTLHRQVRAEGVTEDVDAIPDTGAACRSSNEPLHHLLRQRLGVVAAQNAHALQAAVTAERRR